MEKLKNPGPHIEGPGFCIILYLFVSAHNGQNNRTGPLSPSGR